MKKYIFILSIITMSTSIQAQIWTDNDHLETEFENGIRTTSKDVKAPLPETTIKLPNTNVSPPKGETRIVYWLHGLAGSPDSWKAAADVSENESIAANITNWEARKIISKRFTYSEDFKADNNPLWDDSYGDNYHLRLAATQVRDQIDQTVAKEQPEGSDPNINFIVAHSQGGLVTSALLYNDNFGTPFANTIPQSEQNYGGVVLFSSSQQGALLLNNREDFQEVIEEDAHVFGDLIASIVPVPAQSPYVYNALLGAYNTIAFFQDLSTPIQMPECLNQDILYTNHGDMIFDFILCTLEPNMVPITNGYKVDAPELIEINSTTTGIDSDNPLIMRQIPKVAFYGSEPTNKLVWRTLRWSEKTGGDSSLDDAQASPNAATHFQANDDVTLMNEVSGYVDALESAHSILNHELTSLAYFIINPIDNIFSIENELQEIINNIDDSIDVINNIDDQYKIAIGVKTSYSSGKYCTCSGEISLGNGDGMQNFNITWQSSSAEGIPDCIDGLSVGMIDDSVNPINVNYGEYNCSFFNDITWLENDSDGVVLAESAMGAPNLTRDPIPLINSSHMQVRNDENLKWALKDVYDGEVGLFFRTEEKH